MLDVMSGSAVVEDIDAEVVSAAAYVLSLRARLDALCEEALVTPGMAAAPVRRLAELVSTGELDRGIAALSRVEACARQELS